MDMDKDKSTSGRKETMTHKLGDKVERLGEKLREKGATKLGNSVYRMGNKIEHSGEK